MTEKTIPPTIVPICIYHRNTTSGTIGYLGSSVINETGLVCQYPKLRHKNWYLYQKIFAVNPMITPIPSYMRLICAKQSESADNMYSTISVKTTYDPFNLEENCVYFVTWTLPVPYTTPLYLYETGSGILPTFDKRKDLKVSTLSPLYVLTEKPMKNTIFIGEHKKWFKQGKNIPKFLFKNYMGRCLPDPDGETIMECSLNEELEMIKPLSLLEYLAEREKEYNKTNIWRVVPRFFKKINVVVICVVLGILLISIGIVVKK